MFTCCLNKLIKNIFFSDYNKVRLEVKIEKERRILETAVWKLQIETYPYLENVYLKIYHTNKELQTTYILFNQNDTHLFKHGKYEFDFLSSKFIIKNILAKDAGKYVLGFENRFKHKEIEIYLKGKKISQYFNFIDKKTSTKTWRKIAFGQIETTVRLPLISEVRNPSPTYNSRIGMSQNVR